MHEIDMASPSLGQDPDEDDGGTVLDFPGQGFGSLDFRGLDATPDEIGAVVDAADEADAKLAAEALAALPDADLDALADEGEGYDPARYGPGTEFAAWMDALPYEQFGAVRAEAAELGGEAGELSYLDFARQLDADLAAMNGREHDRQAQDAAERDRRSGPRHRRPSDEVALSNGLARAAAGTYLYGGRPAADLAADPGIDGLLGISTATVLDAEDELRYQVTGQGLPPARSRRQPLPPVGGLARTLGLIS